MDKEVSKKMHTIMKRNGAYVTCGIYETLAALLIGLSAITCQISISATLFSLYSLLTVGINYIKALAELEDDKYRQEHIEEYNELVKLYNDYLDNIANIIKQYEYSDDLQLCIALDFLLDSGFFSLDNNFSYKEFEKNDERFLDMLGSFIVTGNGVCRHTTAFMMDLLKRLDVNCFKISCTNIRTKGYHAMVGIISNGKKYSFDFTNHFCGTLNGNYIYEVGSNDKLYEINQLSIIKKEYKKLPIRDIDFELIKEYAYGIDDDFFDLFRSMYHYSLECDELKKDISEKTLKLMPRE